MAEWVQLLLAGLTIVGSVVGAVATVAFLTGRRLTGLDANIQATALAVANLAKVVDGLSERQGDDRKESIANINAARIEIDARIHRQTERIEKGESAFAGLVASVREGFADINATLRERAAPSAQASLIDQLRGFVEVQKLMKAA